MTKRFLAPFVACVMAAGLAAVTPAGVVVYEDGDKKIEVGGRMQIQYAKVDPDGGESIDELFFRRLRPYISGSVTENWSGKIQFDFGEAIDQNEVSIKDAYMRYTGLKNGQLTIGNQKPGFSRQFMTSSKYQQLVGRGFAGDHNFGSPDRAMVLKYDGYTGGKRVNWSVAGGFAQHDPNADFMDFDSVVVAQGDWNEGHLLVGRVDVHPLGQLKFRRGDFDHSKPKFNISAATFTWSNDDDNNTYTDPSTGMSLNADRADLDSANGHEISAGFRGHGVSVDAEYQVINGETVDTAFTGGLYVNGETDLDILNFNGGYMVIPNRLELAVAWDSIDADGYEASWDRTIFGVNVFVNRHNLKFQLNYIMGENALGVQGDDVDTVQAQAQFVF